MFNFLKKQRSQPISDQEIASVLGEDWNTDTELNQSNDSIYAAIEQQALAQVDQQYQSIAQSVNRNDYQTDQQWSDAVDSKFAQFVAEQRANQNLRSQIDKIAINQAMINTIKHQEIIGAINNISTAVENNSIVNQIGRFQSNHPFLSGVLLSLLSKKP